MQKIKYCLPIIVEKLSEAKDLIKAQKEDYDYFELWLDYLTDYNRDEIKTLCQELGSRLLLLFRRQQLDPIEMPLEERLSVMQIASECGVYVDLDIRIQSTELENLTGIKSNIILSYHNYNETPSDDSLQMILQKMRVYSPAIYKFSCFCQNRGDALRLLKLQRELEIGGYHGLVFGMGEKGVITRVFAPLWGAEMVFAPQTRGKASAVGQLSKDELEVIFAIINA